MQLITCHHGKLQTLADSVSPLAARNGFSSGLPPLDALAPGGLFARGAVHELLTSPSDGHALFLAMLLGARAAFAVPSPPPAASTFELYSRERVRGQTSNDVAIQNFPGFYQSKPSAPNSEPPNLLNPRPASTLIWCDPAGELYPPALAAMGFALDRLVLLRPRTADPTGKDLIWAVAEALACKGVGAVIAPMPRLSRIGARRIQLAAEAGGGVGLLLRHLGPASLHHAAATRWLVRPAPAPPTLQRWTLQLLHGHGGHVGHTLCLEHCRETNRLHTSAALADRPAEPRPLPAPAGVA